MPNLTQDEIEEFLKKIDAQLGDNMEERVKKLMNLTARESRDKDKHLQGGAYRTSKEQEERFLNRYNSRPEPLEVVRRGPTLDQRFEELEAKLKDYIDRQIGAAIKTFEFAAKNQMDAHAGELIKVAHEMQETVADIRMEWDEFQEDER